MARRKRTIGHTSNGRGSLLLERVLPGVGKVRMASGTADHQALADINKMLDAFAEGVPPRFDLLEAIASKRVKPMHALSLWRQDRVEEIPRADVLPMLADVYATWAAGLEVDAAYKAQIASTFRQLLALGDQPRLQDLPALLAARRDVAQANATLVGFNRNKAHVQGFVKAVLGDDHALYRAIVKIKCFKVEEEPDRKALPPVLVAHALARLTPEREMAGWSLVVTGMRPKEYWARPWNLDTDRVHVGKSKTDAGRRDIPLWAVGLPVLPTVSRDAFEGMWERRLGDDLGIYDLRRSFAVWMEDAGIPRSRRKMYLGHAAGDITGMYERRELDAWLCEDAKRLDSFAGEVVRGAMERLHPPRMVVVA